MNSGWPRASVRLTGSNTYTGDTSVYGSALIFKSGSMPASGNLSADVGGYIGTEDTAFGTAPQTFIDRFNPAMRGGIIGFDSPGSALAVSGKVELARTVIRTSTGGVPVLVGDVADVGYGAELRQGAVSRDAEGEVVSGISWITSGRVVALLSTAPVSG